MKNAKIVSFNVITFMLAPFISSFAEDLPNDVQILKSQRQDAIEKIDRRYSAELEKLKVKYTKMGDLDAANAINKMINELKPNFLELRVAGEWVFDFKGKRRHFKFKEDLTFRGEWPEDGSTISGKWKLEGEKIALRDDEAERWLPQHLKIISDEELIFIGPTHKMTGKRK